LLLLAAAAAAPAQDWPGKTVRIVVPFGAGSTPDIVARLVADGLQQKYPTSTFVVENKPGASGNLGTDAIAKAAPDGSTIGVSIGGPLAINTLLFAKLPYDPHKDIVPVTQLVTQPSVLAVNPSLGVNSVAELVSLLKNNPANTILLPSGTAPCPISQWKQSRSRPARSSCTCLIPVRRRPSPR